MVSFAEYRSQQRWGDSWESQPRDPDGKFGSGDGTEASKTPPGGGIKSGAGDPWSHAPKINAEDLRPGDIIKNPKSIMPPAYAEELKVVSIDRGFLGTKENCQVTAVDVDGDKYQFDIPPSERVKSIDAADSRVWGSSPDKPLSNRDANKAFVAAHDIGTDLGATSVNFRDIDPAVAATVYETLAGLHTEYPGIRLGIISTATATKDIGGGAIAWTGTPNGVSNISLSPVILGGPVALVDARLRSGEENSEFHPPNCYTVAATITHEFGHAMMDQSSSYSATAHGIENAINAYAARNGLPDPAVNGIDMQPILSQYANSSLQEATAEAFAEYKIDGANAREMATSIAKVLETSYTSTNGPIVKRSLAWFRSHRWGDSWESQPRGPDGKFGEGSIAPLQGDTKGGRFSSDLSLAALQGINLKSGTLADAVASRMTTSMGITPDEGSANLVALASEMSPAEAEAASHWYEEAQTFNNGIAASSGLDPHVVAGMTAALSPGQLWESNMRGTALVAAAVSEEGRARVVDQAMADRVNAVLDKNPGTAAGFRLQAGDTFGKVMDSSSRAGGVLIAKDANLQVRTYDNFDKAVQLGAANDPAKIDEVLQGAKCRSFFNCMDNPADKTDVCVDTHMMRAMVNGAGSPEGEDRIRMIADHIPTITGSPIYNGASIGAYPIMADTVRSAATAYNKANGTTYTPLQFQAIAWTQQLNDYPRPKINAILQGKE